MTLIPTLPVDENERNIFRHNLGTSLTAEAGAGTGKTSLLVDRLIGLSLHHGNSLSRIVAITYTEKAAEELFDRVRQGLEKKLAACTSPADIHKYSDILAEIETANISTIHGLASSIVHDRAIQAGIDPEFGHIDPKDEIKLVREAIFESLKNPDEERDKWLAQFVALSGKINSLLEISYELYEKRHIFDVSAPKDHSSEHDIIAGEIIDLTRKLYSFAVASCHDQTDKGFINIATVHSSIPQGWEDQPNLLYRWLDQVAALKVTAGNQKYWDNKDNLKSFKTDVGFLKENAVELLAILRREAIENVLVWLKSTLIDVQKKKMSMGKIGFSDQLSIAHGLLKSLDIRADIADRYQRLLIDEFQDTDPLQVEIAMYLSAVQSDVDSVFDLPLEPGKLSVVGDPKQSIYRFRGADIETYKQASEMIVKTGKSIQIKQNFRSSKGIINFVNAFFGSIWSTVDQTGFAYTEIAPDPNRHQPSPETCVTVLLPNESLYAEKQKVDDLRKAEARAIASTIIQSIQKPKWTICDVRNRELRPVKYGDFALLFPRTTSIDIYTAVFDKCGIPFQIDGGKNFFRSQIATEFHSCLAAIDNPADRLSVIAALRSRFLSVSDREIFEWQKSCNGVMDYRNVSDNIRDEIKPVLQILSHLHQVRSEVPADQLIDRFLGMTNAIPQLKSQTNSWSSLAAIDRFREHACSWSRDNSCDLRGFCRYFNDLIEGGDDKGSGGTSGSRDAVKMMTIHASKGLEFPVVALANFFGPTYKSPSTISKYSEKQFEVRLGSAKSGHFETAGYGKLLQYDRQAETQENLRLMYVAMTRARDHLLIPKFVERDKDGVTKGAYHNWLSDFLQAENKLNSDGVNLWREVEHSNSTSLNITPKSISIDQEMIDPISAHSELSIWHTERNQRLSSAMKRIPVRIAPSKISAENIDIDSSEYPSSIISKDAQSIGNAFHVYMAKCSLNDNFDEQLAFKIAVEHHIDLEQIAPLVNKFLSSQLWQEMLNSQRIWRELPITALINSARIQGIIDVVFEGDHGLFHIVDYKTGAINLSEHHQQLRLYTDALRASISKNIRSARIYYTAFNRTDNVPLPEHV